MKPRGKTARPLVAAMAALAALAAGALALETRPQAQTTGPLRTAPDGRPLRVTFADEFNSFRPWNGRSGVWRTMYGNGKKTDIGQRTIANNKEVQVYVDADMVDDHGRRLGLNPFSIKNGMLHITANRVGPEMAARLRGYRFISGVISSQPSFSQTYGYFEMRARTPTGKGLWPAFWMLPADMGWPPEIDVMENIGNPTKVYGTVHSKVQKKVGKEHRVTPGFHTYAVAWDPKNIIWYIDGREVFRTATPGDHHEPMFLVANMAMGGSWAGVPDASTRFPATYEIDYIRAYQFR
ncbi:MAG TPA: glycoside hydrolase family 16 protein [Caulobacteraceae bacterium]|nr:glycoside hydrolase family 16 protein [Caulobacteraceae bacterium]